jgi:hypothetical protein
MSRVLKNEFNYIHIIGAGGNGSILTKLLAQYLSKQDFSHRTHITITDKDIVEEHNLERQEFTIFDIGRAKCEVLKERCLVQGYPNVNYNKEYINAKIIYAMIRTARYSVKQSKTTLHIFNCVDNNESRHQILSSLFYLKDGNSYPIWSLEFYNINVIVYDLGNADTFGQVVLYANMASDLRKDNYPFPARVAVGQDLRLLYPDMYNIADAKDSPTRQLGNGFSCAKVEIEKVPQVLFANHITAGIAFEKFLKILNGKSVEAWSQWISEPVLRVESELPFLLHTASEYEAMFLENKIDDTNYYGISNYYRNVAFEEDKTLHTLNTVESLYERKDDEDDEDDEDDYYYTENTENDEDEF